MKLTLFEKAITWCDEGLEVSFECDCICMAECKDFTRKTIHGGVMERHVGSIGSVSMVIKKLFSLYPQRRKKQHSNYKAKGVG